MLFEHPPKYLACRRDSGSPKPRPAKLYLWRGASATFASSAPNWLAVLRSCASAAAAAAASAAAKLAFLPVLLLLLLSADESVAGNAAESDT
jgi:hypothetical protein